MCNLSFDYRKGVHLAVCLGATLTASHVYMVNVWDAGLDYVMDFQGFLGAVMVALILAISRPRASYYAAFSSRFLWGLAIAHLFVALICVGAVFLSGEVDFIGPTIAYGICGYVFSLIIWILALNSEILDWPECSVSESSATNAPLAALGPLVHLPIYALVISASFYESLDSWTTYLKDIQVSFQVFAPNIYYAAGTLALLLILNYLTSKPRIWPTWRGEITSLFVLIYSLFTTLSFIGMLTSESDSTRLPQTIASIILPFGLIYLVALTFNFFSTQKPWSQRPPAKDAILVLICTIVAYLSFIGLATFEALIFALVSGAFVGGLLAYLSNLEAKMKQRTAELQIEKSKSDALLENILPSYVISDLKEKGVSEPRHFENISIMFTDFVGFTKIAGDLSASALISDLNKIFTKFDEIVAAHDSERIKTIGDAYMCVSGLSVSEANPATNLVNVGHEMLSFLEQHNLRFGTSWQMRIGIASGDCVGGVVGEKKYLFDLFGDTVNMASRMESHSEPNRINIDQATFSSLHATSETVIEAREAAYVKGKGEVLMFFVDSGPAAAV